MNFSRVFAVVITLGVLSTASSGQETQQQPAAQQPAKPAEAPAQPAPQQSTPTPQGETPTPPPPSAAKQKTGVIKDDEFIPTQEINPDEDVTFPVDI